MMFSVKYEEGSEGVKRKLNGRRAGAEDDDIESREVYLGIRV